MAGIAAIEKRAAKIQDEAHQTINYIMASSTQKVKYQDAMSVFLFNKIAELELQIEELQNEKTNF